jgi:hypothetical protein
MSEFKLEIDFFEYSFLLEACIPPRPIARTMFWNDSVDIHYHNMSVGDRSRLWNWINKNGVFTSQLEKGEEYVSIWNARYDPNNQYNVTTSHGDTTSTHPCFKMNGKYYKKRNTSVIPEFITKIEQIVPPEE